MNPIFPIVQRAPPDLNIKVNQRGSGGNTPVWIKLTYRGAHKKGIASNAPKADPVPV